MLERSTPPLPAWRYTSWMAWPDQLAFSRKVWPVFTIFRARVGHRATHRWQLTHLLSSASIFLQSRVVAVDLIGALALAHPAGDAPVACPGSLQILGRSIP